MIIVTHDYRIIKKAEMTDSFIIRTEYVVQVWDITAHVIGIAFVPSYDKYKYKIILDEPSQQLLASDILEMIKTNLDITISGTVEIK